jgi:hypothetical protein
MTLLWISKTDSSERRALIELNKIKYMDIFRQVWKDYCDELEREPRLGLRLRPEVEMRAAFANAAAPFFHNTVCARLLKKDRTTIHHYIRAHETYFTSSAEYRDYFKLASRIITDSVDSFPTEALTLEAQNFLKPHEQIDTIQGLIETLSTFKEKIQYRLRYGKPESLPERKPRSMADDGEDMGEGIVHDVLRDEQLQVQDEGRFETNVEHRGRHEESAVV